MNPRDISLVFAGGGTGGHLYPAIAIANRVKELAAVDQNISILFVGTKRGIEFRLRDQIGYPLELINIRGMARSFTPSNLLVPFLIVRSLMQSRAILKEVTPDVVIGTGGYVSWPILKMAGWLKIATVIQEQNSFPGIATRQLAGKAKRVYLGFDEARRHLPAWCPALTTGNPVRSDLAHGDKYQSIKYFGLNPDRKTVLILGGSQGARSVNQAILDDLDDSALPEDIQLVWQTGKLDHGAVARQLGESNEAIRLVPFEANMHFAYAAADIVIARAGAISIAEIEAACLPSLLVPYPFAAGDHQRKNAAAYAGQNYARVVDPDELKDTRILTEAIKMLRSGEAEKMNQALKQKQAGKKPAVDLIAEDILKLVAQSQEVSVGS